MAELTLNPYEQDLATAILGVDTLWGGDVANPSGMGRFIADCYFSGKPYPEAYTHELAAKLREAGGLSAGEPDLDLARRYLAAFDGFAPALERVRTQALAFPALRRRFVESLTDSLSIMLQLALERLGDGPEVPYSRCVEASTGKPPALIDATPWREEVRSLLAAVGEDVGAEGDDAALLAAVDRWRAASRVPKEALSETLAELVEELDSLTIEHVLPHLPRRMHRVPRTNIEFMPIEDAWFSGSMNYLGRARDKKGRPEYEATYEINADLEISRPELRSLVAHEVVPGHVMTFALIQHLNHRGRIGFEGTVLTMNSRSATLWEGIANTALLFAEGVTAPEQLEDPAQRIAFALDRLQDIAKSNASYLTWADGQPQETVARTLRSTCLVSNERADKLSGPWAHHPILGRMYMPCYHSGTQLVLDLMKDVELAKLIPTLYGCQGLVDCVTVLSL